MFKISYKEWICGQHAKEGVCKKKVSTKEVIKLHKTKSEVKHI